MKFKKYIIYIITLFLISTTCVYAEKDLNIYALKALNEVKLNNIEVIDTERAYLFRATVTLYILCKNSNDKRLYIILRCNKYIFGSNGPWHIVSIDKID